MTISEEWTEVLERFEIKQAKLLKELKIKKFDRIELLKKQYELEITEESVKNIDKYLKRLDLIEKVRKYENSSRNS